MSEEIRFLPRSCSFCRKPFRQIVGTGEERCENHRERRTITLPAYGWVENSSKPAYHTKEIQWAKIPDYLQ